MGWEGKRSNRSARRAAFFWCPPPACSLTCLFAPGLERAFPLGCFPYVVAGCRTPVLGSWRASWAGFAGFRCTGWAGGGRGGVPESPAGPGGGEPAGRGGPFPGQAQVVSQRAGEPELGVDGDDQPGPPVRGVRVADFGGGPAKDLLEQPEGVLDVEAAQERLPVPVHLIGRGAGR